MYCKNCGAALPGNKTKCPKCGTENLRNAVTPTAGEANVRGFSSKKNILIIIIALAAVLLTGGGIAAAVIINKPAAANSLTDKLQLDERCLSDSNYEQADAYIGSGETEKAREILRESDDRIQSRLDELERQESKPEESSAPAFGSMGTVTILGKEYDIATTTSLRAPLKTLFEAKSAEHAVCVVKPPRKASSLASSAFLAADAPYRFSLFKPVFRDALKYI